MMWHRKRAGTEGAEHGRAKDSGLAAKAKALKRKLHPRTAAKRSELREKANLGISTGSLLMGAASLALTLNRRGVDHMAGGAGPEPRDSGIMIGTYGQGSRRPAPRVASRSEITRLRQLTPQDIESSCRGKGVRYVVLKASGGNIGTMRYRQGEAEAFLSQYGHLGYWKKERVGDVLYYYLGNRGGGHGS